MRDERGGNRTPSLLLFLHFLPRFRAFPHKPAGEWKLSRPEKPFTPVRFPSSSSTTTPLVF